MISLAVRRMLLDPPLDPSPDEARSWLRRELLRPEYQRDRPLERLRDWVGEQFGRALDATAGFGIISTVIGLALFAALALTLVALLSRLRRTARVTDGPGPVLTDRRVGAEELRSRALAALAAERYDDALVEAFRALTARQIERGRLDDVPAATAHEVASALESAHPQQAPAIARAAARFDLVLYGDRPATREQAESVLALDDDLVGVR